MRKIRLFIAMSLDGFIADCNGNVDWLEGHGEENENIDSYSAFAENIDTVIMGWNTYHQVVTELSPGQWVYEDFTTYVVTHKEKQSSERIRFTGENPAMLVKKLRDEDGKDIWICGGSNIIGQLVNEDLIDEYYITVIPVLLGSGIGLFDKAKKEIKLKLVKAQSYNGMTDLVYVRR